MRRHHARLALGGYPATRDRDGEAGTGGGLRALLSPVLL